MRLIAIFDDLPAMADVRRQQEAEHLRYLEMHHDEIPMAGGLRDGGQAGFVGGLWVFEVASRERAVALIEADPYQQACPRPYRLLAWGKALPHVQVTM